MSFFSRDRIKARWTKIGKWFVKFVWPSVQQALEDALREELERRTHGTAPPKPEHTNVTNPPVSR